MHEVALLILTAGFSTSVVILTAAYALRSLFRPGRKEIQELRGRVAALEQRAKVDAERLETVREIVLSQDAEARRRLMQTLNADEPASTVTARRMEQRLE